MGFSGIVKRVEKNVISVMNAFNVKKYMKLYTKHLQKCGVNIADYEGVGYLDPSVYFDPAAYNLITIGHNVTISKEVMMLTHDFSIWNGLITLDESNESKRFKFLKPITIGNNCFVGARTFILPGTTIGDNCIIGAASVIKGNIPSGTVWCGNPAKQIMTTKEFAKKHLEKNDYLEVK